MLCAFGDVFFQWLNDEYHHRNRLHSAEHNVTKEPRAFTFGGRVGSIRLLARAVRMRNVA